jgi:putative sterol carrier protein
MDLLTLTDRVKALVGTDSGLGASFKFATDQGIIAVDAKQVPNVVTNDDIETDCTMEISIANAIDLMNGDLNPMTAFMMGKLKIKGDMAVAMKIGQAIGG